MLRFFNRLKRLKLASRKVPAPAKRGAALFVEELESRQLLSGSGDVVINGTATNDTLTLSQTPGGSVGAVSYVLNNQAPVALSNVTSLTFLADGGDDTLKVMAPAAGPLVTGKIGFDGGTGNNTLILDAGGQAVVTRSQALLVGATQTVSYINVQSTRIGNAAGVSAFAAPDTMDAATAFTGLSPQERFVQALYLDVLGRAGTKAELNSWARLLHGPGADSKGQSLVATDIEHSQEARDRLVRSWYVSYLGRQAQHNEEKPWVNLLLAGQTEEQVLSRILGSSEFYQHAQTLSSSGTGSERFAQALYQQLLGRTGSPAEVQSTVAAMSRNSRQALALGFLVSQEHRLCEFEGYYDVLLHRPSDAPGLEGWALSSWDAGSVRISFESTTDFFFNG
jgi:hypothetical protein